MTFRHMQVIFSLDGTGVYYNPLEPLMLDGILASALCRHHVSGEPPARDETPFDIPIPLAKWHIDNEWGWKASALFPINTNTSSTFMIRKRFRQNRIEITNGSPSLTNCAYHDLNMPLPMLLVDKLIAYAVGDIRKVKRELKRNVRYLGKKRAYGRGAVVSVDVCEIEHDWSISKDGFAVRYIPVCGGPKLVRPRPPYWNSVGRVDCCNIGDLIGQNYDEERR